MTKVYLACPLFMGITSASDNLQVVSLSPKTSLTSTIWMDLSIPLFSVSSTVPVVAQGCTLLRLTGTVVAIYDIGCFFGAVSAAWLGEVLGRRKSVLLGTTIMTVGAILQISSYSVAQMIVGRIIAGIGNGVCHSFSHQAGPWMTEFVIF